VLAAASLAQVFEQVADEFEAAHPAMAVELTFGGSSALARQLRDGADADVFASADEVVMRDAVAAGDAASPTSFARNRLTIVVEKGNPKGVQGIADLVSPRMAVVVCASEVPCGRLARAAFARAGVAVEPRSLEPDVKAVLARVALGEADAGVVYATDALAARGKVDEVVLAGTEERSLQAVYQAGVVTRSAEPDLARAWIDFLAGPAARRALDGAGFLEP
jgi:molybdate transport system substrate-binding protein